MKLENIYWNIYNYFHIDEELRVYYNKNQLIFIDHMPEMEVNDKITLNEFNGILIIIYIDNENKINCIEPTSLTLINSHSKKIFQLLTDLIGNSITDIEKYKEFKHEDENDEYYNKSYIKFN